MAGRKRERKARRAPTDRPLALPHERDESAEVASVTHTAIRQAACDLAQGQVDTDNYTRVAEITSAPRHKRRIKP